MAENRIRGILSDPSRQKSSARAVERHLAKMTGDPPSDAGPGRQVDRALGRTSSGQAQRATGARTRSRAPSRVKMPTPVPIPGGRSRDASRAKRRSQQTRSSEVLRESGLEDLVDETVSDPRQREEVLRELLSRSGDIPRGAEARQVVEEAVREAGESGPAGVAGAAGASTGFGKRAFISDYARVAWDPDVPYPQIDPTRTSNEDRPRTIAAGYDPFNSILRVTFRNGRVYEYLDVPDNIWQAFQRTPSPGKMIYTVLDQYFYREISI